MIFICTNCGSTVTTSNCSSCGKLARLNFSSKEEELDILRLHNEFIAEGPDVLLYVNKQNLRDLVFHKMIEIYQKGKDYRVRKLSHRLWSDIQYLSLIKGW